jgi:hypothetical protein
MYNCFTCQRKTQKLYSMSLLCSRLLVPVLNSMLPCPDSNPNSTYLWDKCQTNGSTPRRKECIQQALIVTNDSISLYYHLLPISAFSLFVSTVRSLFCCERTFEVLFPRDTYEKFDSSTGKISNFVKIHTVFIRFPQWFSINPDHNLRPYYLKINCNIILPSAIGVPSSIFPSCFQPKFGMHISSLQCVLYAPHIPSFLLSSSDGE